MDVTQDSLDLIASIYDSVLNPNEWTDVLDQLADRTGAKVVNILLSDHTFPEILISAASRLFQPDDIEEYVVNYAENEVPVVMGMSEARAGQWVPIDDLLNRVNRTRQTDQTAKWLYQKFNIDQRASMRLNETAAWLDCLTYHFEMGRGPMTAEEQGQAKFFHPHFARTVEISRPFNLLQVRFQAVLSALDRFHIGTFILFEDGTVVIKNREAARILELKDGLGLDASNRLTVTSDEATGLFRRSVKIACETVNAQNTATPTLLTIDRRSMAEPFMADIAPLGGTEDVLERGFKGALVLVIDPTNREHVSSRGMNLLYQLTEAEDAVCELVLQGLGNEEIADSRNVSPGTVRSQLKSLYAKTDTRNRVGLIRLAHTINIPIDEA
ncbi:MAG: helix-turn-helix transcriptional regulator [Rhodospirillaceae bacterium]|jgi:DNA-binding CsgD family transcriptional regulator|nr:helix-turn-helix transcriptional regulator [Rhodospirillaceae bacterium]MBT5193219.1 helix-turn-helix transcriptional regulator [Rhodospirillaceae bacterium]MBT5895773.1 helix-turn-helix transcriptional regulator [Rhodospirillaceae bacterium]MBT6427540.1 helix-turn-helix transcriptional regulator [Rhodospirillaceae bacterium]MBT7759410.1 helix-turn-helix transcriptional regulator [Rhodospirillaceae bacterium]